MSLLFILFATEKCEDEELLKKGRCCGVNIMDVKM